VPATRAIPLLRLANYHLEALMPHGPVGLMS
jgi:hypothetical protein